jgi:hypothetical protein
MFRRSSLGLIALIFAFCVALAGCAYGEHIDRGDAYFQQGQYQRALTEYQAARKLDPESPEAAAKIHAAREKLVGKYAQDVEKSLAAGDLLGAVYATASAYEQLPRSPLVADMIDDVSARADEEAANYRRQNDWANTLVVYHTVSENLPPKRTEFAQKAAQVRSTWAAELEARAKEAEANNLDGLALLKWAKAYHLAGGAMARARRDALRTELAEAYRYLAVLDGDQGDDAYQIVAARLAATRTPGTLVVRTQKPADADAIDAGVYIEISRPRFETERSRRTEFARYQSGTRQVENPFYARAQDDVIDEERRLLERQKDVARYQADVERYRGYVQDEGPSPNTSTGAEQSLYNAENRLERAREQVIDQRERVLRAKEELADTDQFKVEPVYRDHQFTVTTHTRVAAATVEAEIRHSDDRKPIHVSSKVYARASDDAHPAQSIANVPENPLNLPSDAALAGKLFEDAVAPVARAISDSFEAWRALLLTQAGAAGAVQELANTYAIYVLTNPGYCDPKVVADLTDITGIPDPVEVLRR